MENLEVIRFGDVGGKIISIRGQNVILDSDVAELYGVETRDINKAVKNNPEKFPQGYIFEISNEELNDLRCKNSTTNLSSMTRVLPKAFTRKGCYMLATILKGEKAIETTLAIIEAFDKLSELQATVNEMTKEPDEAKQKSLLKKSGEIISNLISDGLDVTDIETTIETIIPS